MRVSIFRDEYKRHYQVIDHDSQLQVIVTVDGKIRRQRGPFGVLGNDPFTDWDDLEEGTGVPREQIQEEFKLAAKKF